MKHTLNIENLIGFESITILASSTKDNKKLEIISNIDDNNNIITKLKVTVNNECKIISNNLEFAITYYNHY